MDLPISVGGFDDNERGSSRYSFLGGLYPPSPPTRLHAVPPSPIRPSHSWTTRKTRKFTPPDDKTIEKEWRGTKDKSRIVSLARKWENHPLVKPISMKLSGREFHELMNSVDSHSESRR